MNFPRQHHKKPLSQFAKQYDISLRSAQRIAKELGATKSREQYESDAKIRRETAYNLRQSGLKYKEIAEQLGISLNNAQQLVRRYEQSL
ncbi:hypothetical protein BKG96_06665 [Rodentibacter caecimuris]|uniref:RNA polymerase sigma factor 70 region 4 type 2 domain-containing protein n=1 Tax=Rodentibacter caecimuris TaxID=1796644 RepID=A0A1V3KLA3_9PAST|nr:helix-turn-helix domain-containing protein [Rodentibacter heylii]OOF78170.1 hypothetical protein BKG96_06665 [Rodentibacter heylii]